MSASIIIIGNKKSRDELSDLSSSSSLFESSKENERIKKKKKTLKLKKRMNSTTIESEESYNVNMESSNNKLK